MQYNATCAAMPSLLGHIVAHQYSRGRQGMKRVLTGDATNDEVAHVDKLATHLARDYIQRWKALLGSRPIAPVRTRLPPSPLHKSDRGFEFPFSTTLVATTLGMFP